MKKIILSVLMAFALGTSALAVPAMHKLFPFKQSDGTTVMLYRCGDEHFSFKTTPDNQIVMKNTSGFYCYAIKQNGSIVASDIRVHDMDQRTAEEKEFVANNTLKPAELVAIHNSTSATTEVTTSSTTSRSPLKINGASTSDGLGKYGTKSAGTVPSIGKLTIPVIMVEYTNQKFLETTTSEYMTRFFNEEGFSDLTVGTYQAKGSVKDYFMAQSNGMFVPTFEIVAKVQLDTTYNYYGCHNGNSNDYRLLRMVKDAVAKAVAQGVDFKKYYYGNTNKVPLVSILYAGYGEATGGEDDTIWPQEGDIPTYNSNMSNFNFGSFFVGNELLDSKSIMGMGVFVHEFSHALSLPDFYVTDYSYTGDDAFGKWSVMDTGEYNDGSYNPTGYTAYEKSFMGWLDMKELTTAESITLGDPNENDNCAVIIRNPNRSVETFILENRQPGTWYPSSFGNGLLVTRINYDKSSWTKNDTNNDEDFKRACILTANGQKIDDTAGSGHLYGSDKTKIESFPLFLGSTLDKPVYNITKHKNGTITLNYLDRTLRPEITSNTNIYKKVTSLSDLTSLDSVIFVNEEDGKVASTTKTASGYNSTGIVLEDNMAKGNDDVMTFQIVYSTSSKKWGFRYQSSGKNYYLCASNGGALTSATKTSAASLATISFNDGNATIKFGGTYSASTIGYSYDDTRFCCFASGEGKPVQIYKKTTTVDGIADVKVEKARNNGYRYNLQGQRVNDNQKGIIILNGKKILNK